MMVQYSEGAVGLCLSLVLDHSPTAKNVALTTVTYVILGVAGGGPTQWI